MQLHALIARGNIMRNSQKIVLVTLLILSLFSFSCNTYQNPNLQDSLKKEIQTIKESHSNDESTLQKEFCKIIQKHIGINFGTKYQSDYDNFMLTESGYVVLSYPGGDDEATKGTIIDLIVPEEYEGIISVIKTDYHKNYDKYCYPNYNEDNPHNNCYLAMYLKKDGKGFNMAQGNWSVPNHPYTACASSLEEIYELFKKYGYDSTCNSYFSSYKL